MPFWIHLPCLQNKWPFILYIINYRSYKWKSSIDYNEIVEKWNDVTTICNYWDTPVVGDKLFVTRFGGSQGYWNGYDFDNTNSLMFGEGDGLSLINIRVSGFYPESENGISVVTGYSAREYASAKIAKVEWAKAYLEQQKCDNAYITNDIFTTN